MQIGFRREANRNYMVLRMEEREGGRYTAQMLSRNTLPGFLPFHEKLVDGEGYYYYDITSRQPLERILENRAVTGEEIRLVISGLLQALNQLERFLIDEDQICLEPKLIYVDPDCFQCSWCLIPGKKGDFPEEFRSLAQYFLDHVNQNDGEAVVLAFGILRQSRKENFGLGDIEREMKRAEKTAGLGKTAELGAEERPGSERLGTERSGTARLGTERPGTERLGTERPGSGRAGREKSGSERSGTERPGSERAGRERPGNERVGNERPGLEWEERTRWEIQGKEKIGKEKPEKEKLEKEEGGERKPKISGIVKSTVLFGLAVFPAIFVYFLWGFSGLFTYKYQLLLWGGIVAAAGIFLIKDEVSGKEEAEASILEKGIPSRSSDREEIEIFFRDEPVFSRPVSENEEEFDDDGELQTVLLTAHALTLKAYKLTPLSGGEEIAVNYFPFLIGKNKSLCDHCLMEPGVSRLHLKLEESGGSFFATDLNSTNGTSINGRQLETNERCEIALGDEIGIAGKQYRFQSA